MYSTASYDHYKPQSLATVDQRFVELVAILNNTIFVYFQVERVAFNDIVTN